MTTARESRKRARTATAVPRVGLFGFLGGGNVGNDGSLEAMLAYLKADQPDAVLDFLCTGPEQVTARYGIPATRLHWYRSGMQKSSSPLILGVKGLGIVWGIGADAFHISHWVRRHDIVIVPGMGVLEATVPLRPWQTPYLMFLLSASGKLFRTKVALVSVGANDIHRKLTRQLITAAARLAYYRSFRDPFSKEAMARMGVDTSGDSVFPDMAFSLPPPLGEPGAPGTVGVGVMDYQGANEDRRKSAEIRAAYVEKMTRFVLWLVDAARPVRLLTGDEADERVVREIVTDVQARRPELAPSLLIAEPVFSLDELMRQIASVDTVVATRFHNVVCALKLAKPTVALAYAAKHDVLMTDMGLAGFCQQLKSLDVDQLIMQFTELESRAGQLRLTMIERNAAKAELVGHQFAELSTVLFPAGDRAGPNPLARLS